MKIARLAAAVAVIAAGPGRSNVPSPTVVGRKNAAPSAFLRELAANATTSIACVASKRGGRRCAFPPRPGIDGALAVRPSNTPLPISSSRRKPGPIWPQLAVGFMDPGFRGCEGIQFLRSRRSGSSLVTRSPRGEGCDRPRASGRYGKHGDEGAMARVMPTRIRGRGHAGGCGRWRGAALRSRSWQSRAGRSVASHGS